MRRGEINEDQLFQKFFKDGRPVDGAGLVQHLMQAYNYVQGMDNLLQRLATADYEIHACSNYPVWYRNIEEKLGLSALGLNWTYISCEGPMAGLRKPSPECYQAIVQHLDVHPGDLILVDDRSVNVEGAQKAGLKGVVFRDAAQLEEELKGHGLQF